MSDIEEQPQTLASQDPAGDHSLNRNVHTQRLQRLASRVSERTQQILRNPDQAQAYATRMAESFRTTDSRRRQERRGRTTGVMLARVVCLQSPTTVSISRLNYTELTRYGLGNPRQNQVNARGLCPFTLGWGRAELTNYLQELFPVLSTTDYDLCRAQRGGRLTPIEYGSWSTEGLREVFMAGRRQRRLASPPTIYIRPNQDVLHVPLGTPTILGRVPDSTPRRPVNETFEETRRLREAQDAALADSLRTDRERDRRRRAIQERLRNIRMRRQERAAIVQQMRETRRAEIPPEPTEGVMVRFRFRGGTTMVRRFLPTMTMDVLASVVGSNPEATREFFLRIPGSTGRLQASTMVGSLAANGINAATTIDVQWEEEQTSDPQSDTDPREELPTVYNADQSTDNNTDQPLVHGADQPQGQHADLPLLLEGADQAIDPVADQPQGQHADLPLLHSADQSVIEGADEDIDPVADQPQGQHADRLPDYHANISDIPSVGNNADQPTDQPLTQDVALDASENDETPSTGLVITVRRPAIFEDLMRQFENETRVNGNIRVQVTGEEAVDEDGVLRDVLTDFWGQLINRHFEGASQAAPRVSPLITTSMWAAIGRIFQIGLVQLGYVPIRFGQASLMWALFGRVPETILLQCWLSALDGSERHLMRSVLDTGLQQDDTEDVLEILDRYRVTTLPTEDNIRRLSVRCSEVHFIESAAFPLHEMHLRQLQTYLPSAESVEELYNRLQPNGRRVARMIRGTPSSPLEQQILDYLRQAVRSMDEDLLQRFLRFVSGSDCVCFENISVQFVNLHGLARRVVAHTCSATLDVPVSYVSFNEFYNELRNQLNAGVWEMDYA